MKHKICPKCNYGWKSKVNKPKACPRCKTRMDVIVKRPRRS